MRPARRNLSPLALAVLALSAAPAGAQQAAGTLPDATSPAGTLPQVTVHGTSETSFAPGPVSLPRVGTDPMEVPQSVTIVNKDLMQSQGAASLASALRNVPGLTIGAAEGGQIGNNINLNGFSARTDLYLDGMRDRGQYYRDVFALDAVEVLMGPSSMLFGRGSTGGVINQVSKKPQLAPFAEVGASVTTNGLLRSTFDIDRPLSETSAFRLAGMAQGGDATDRQQSAVHDQGLAGSLALGIGTPTRITLSAQLQHNRDMADYGLPPLNGAPAAVDRRTAYGFTSDRTESDVGFLSANIEHKLTPTTTVRNQTQFNRVRTDAIETAPQGIGTVSPAGVFTPLAAGAATPPLDQLWVRQQSHDRTIHDGSAYNQTELTTHFATGGVQHALLTGVELGSESYSNQAYSRTGACGGTPLAAGFVSCTPLLDPPQVASPVTSQKPGNFADAHATTASAYFNDTLTLEPQWKLVAGGRHDRYSAHLTNSVPTATSPAAMDQTVNFNSVRLGTIYQPTPRQSLYVSYSTSFNPSLEQLTSTTGANQPLPPERNRAWEAGSKWDLFDGEAAATAAVFQITKYNARSQNPDGTYSATGTVKVNGARAGLSGHLTPRTQVFAAYTYLDANIVDAIAAGTQGKTPANTPRHSAALWSTYALTPQWEIGGGINFASARYANNTDLVSVGPYARFDALVAYHRPRYDIRLNLFNLGDRRYYDALIPSDGGRAVPGLGRSAMLSVVYRL